MDFYKKIVQNKDAASVLSEKEYKCVSLQAISNEAMKENNKRTIRELADEINGHLLDLRTLKDDGDAKNNDKCQKLIEKFEECLVKILNNQPSNVLGPINVQLQELQKLTQTAIRDNNMDDMKKLAERMERNIAVMKQIPEVKTGDEKVLELVNNYTSLLNKVNGIINAATISISAPVPKEDDQKIISSENIQEQEASPPKQFNNKIVLNEVEEKLKLMRQKRLNRLSTFVDQQTKLAEQRSKENSPKNSPKMSNKSSENLSQVAEMAEPETAIKSIHFPEIIKPSLYRAAAQEKLVKTGEQKVSVKNASVDFKAVDEPVVQSGFVSSFRKSFGKSGILGAPNVVGSSTFSTGNLQERSLPQPAPYEKKDMPNDDKTTMVNNKESTKKENNAFSRDATAGVRNSFDKGPANRSFAERQIENTRNQSNLQERSLPQPAPQKIKDITNNDKTPMVINMESPKKENNEFSRDANAGVRNSFGKGLVTRSFAERQIENAKNQTEKSKLKPSNSTKTTPPRTPTQIRKIFNSFNICVMGSNNAKSIEDLPNEFKSPFERELKNVQLKNTGLSKQLDSGSREKYMTLSENDFNSLDLKKVRTKNTGLINEKAKEQEPNNVPFRNTDLIRRLDTFKNSEEAKINSKETNNKEELTPILPPRRDKTHLEKPVIIARKLLRKRQEYKEHEDVKIATNERVIEKSYSQSQISSPSKDNEAIFDAEKTKSKSWMASMDVDPVVTRHNQLGIPTQDLSDVTTITIKRNSSNVELPVPEKYEFSTFRSNSDLVQDGDTSAFDNPLYGVVKIEPPTLGSAPEYTVKALNRPNSLVRQNSISVDAMMISEKTYKEYNHSDAYFAGETKKRVRRATYRRDLSNDSNRFIAIEPVITKLEYAIGAFRGLKRDDDYGWYDKLLSKYYVKVDEILANRAFDKIEKNNLLERLKKASRDLENRVTKNEDILRSILEEQVVLIGVRYEIA